MSSGGGDTFFLGVRLELSARPRLDGESDKGASTLLIVRPISRRTQNLPQHFRYHLGQSVLDGQVVVMSVQSRDWQCFFFKPVEAQAATVIIVSLGRATALAVLSVKRGDSRGDASETSCRMTNREDVLVEPIVSRRLD